MPSPQSNAEPTAPSNPAADELPLLGFACRHLQEEPRQGSDGHFVLN